jgi:nucleoside phosphorylase
LPDIGNNFASVIATKMQSTFPAIKNIIVCGIAGGVPTVTHLGDVVVSTQGVIQYDLGKNKSECFREIDAGKPCSSFLLSAVKYMQANDLIDGIHWHQYVDKVNELTEANFSRPVCINEIYYEEKDNTIVPVTRLASKKSIVHYKKIASANIVQKDPIKRDSLYREKGIVAIEMEGAGIRDAVYLSNNGYLVVRGICDFCDGSKNDVWHNYSAAVAAAYTYALIGSIPTE